MVTYVGEVREGRIVVPESLSAWDGARAIVVIEATDQQRPDREAAVHAFLERMDRGLNVPDGPYPKRSEIYAERQDRYGAGLR